MGSSCQYAASLSVRVIGPSLSSRAQMEAKSEEIVQLINIANDYFAERARIRLMYSELLTEAGRDGEEHRTAVSELNNRTEYFDQLMVDRSEMSCLFIVPRWHTSPERVAELCTVTTPLPETAQACDSRSTYATQRTSLELSPPSPDTLLMHALERKTLSKPWWMPRGRRPRATTLGRRPKK